MNEISTLSVLLLLSLMYILICHNNSHKEHEYEGRFIAYALMRLRYLNLLIQISMRNKGFYVKWQKMNSIYRWLLEMMAE